MKPPGRSVRGRTHRPGGFWVQGLQGPLKQCPLVAGQWGGIEAIHAFLPFTALIPLVNRRLTARKKARYLADAHDRSKGQRCAGCETGNPFNIVESGANEGK